MVEENNSELNVLLANGFEREKAQELLKRFGSAEGALMNEIGGETTAIVTDVPLNTASLNREREFSKRYEQVVKAAQNLDWEGVDVRRQGKKLKVLGEGDLAEAILRQGLDFLKQATNGVDETEDGSHDGSTSFELSSALIQGTEVFSESSLQQLTQMGFSADQALAALIQCEGNVEQALGLLIS